MITLHTYERGGKWFWTLLRGKEVIGKGPGDEDSAAYVMRALQNIKPSLASKGLK
jgi:hypothetical protein